MDVHFICVYLRESASNLKKAKVESE